METDRVVRSLGLVVATHAPIEERAQRTAEIVGSAGGYRWVGIYRVAGDEVVIMAWSGSGPPAHPRFRVGAGLTGAAIASGTTVLCNDVAADPRYLDAFSDTRSEMIVPVLGRDSQQVIGTLDIESGAVGALDEADRVFAERAASALVDLFETESRSTDC